MESFIMRHHNAGLGPYDHLAVHYSGFEEVEAVTLRAFRRGYVDDLFVFKGQERKITLQCMEGAPLM